MFFDLKELRFRIGDFNFVILELNYCDLPHETSAFSSIWLYPNKGTLWVSNESGGAKKNVFKILNEMY